MLLEDGYMQTCWFIFTAIICIFANLTYEYLSTTKSMPPEPPTLPILGNLTWIISLVSEPLLLLHQMKARYGPVFIFTISPQPFIFIADRSLTHRALIQNSASFIDRPAPSPTSTILNRTQLAITLSTYGPTWHHLCCNLIRGILTPSQARAHSSSHFQVLSELASASPSQSRG